MKNTSSSRNLRSYPAVKMADSGEGNAPNGGERVKTAKELKKEAQKKEKMEKFLAKQAKKEENQKPSKVNHCHWPNLPCFIPIFGTEI